MILKKNNLINKINYFFYNYIISRIYEIIFGIIIIYFSYYLANYIYNYILTYARNQIKKNKSYRQNNIIYNILAHILYYFIIIVGFLIILKIFGIETTSIIAIFSAISIIIGLAIQGTLTDIISGIIMVTQQNIHIGDILEFNNTMCSIIDFTLVNITLEEVNSLAIIKLPNRKFQEYTFKNYSRDNYGYIYIPIAISNNNNNISYKEIFSIISNAIKNHKYIIGDIICNVTDMNKPYTLIDVRIPIQYNYYIESLPEIKTLIRDALHKNNVYLATNIINYK
jgi:small-conductance mechanosensitive channel